MKKPELLLPAGSLQSLKTAFLYGADAVYAGTPQMSLRAKSKFPLEDMREGIKFAHNLGKKVYLALNLFSHNKDADKLGEFIETLKNLAPDGVIVSDPGIFLAIKKEIPEMPLHVSTQANVCSYLTVDFWKNLGAELCVLGREVSFDEARKIREICPDIKLEIFIHGAMCVSYSGRCLMSAFMTGRGANQGLCAHSCRWKYKSKLIMEEELRPGEFLTLEEDEHGSYILNSKDLCLMPKLDLILSAGFDSLKIEGRNKTSYYVASVARAYRKAIDDYFENPKSWPSNAEAYFQELKMLQNRGYTLGFFDGVPGETAQDYNETASKSEWRNAGVVRESGDGFLVLELRHKLKKGDKIEILSPLRYEPFEIVLDKIFDCLTNKFVEEISCGGIEQKIKISIAENHKLFPENTVARICLA